MSQIGKSHLEFGQARLSVHVPDISFSRSIQSTPKSCSSEVTEWLIELVWVHSSVFSDSGDAFSMYSPSLISLRAAGRHNARRTPPRVVPPQKLGDGNNVSSRRSPSFLLFVAHLDLAWRLLPQRLTLNFLRVHGVNL